MSQVIRVVEKRKAMWGTESAGARWRSCRGGLSFRNIWVEMEGNERESSAYSLRKTIPCRENSNHESFVTNHLGSSWKSEKAKGAGEREEGKQEMEWEKQGGRQMMSAIVKTWVLILTLGETSGDFKQRNDRLDLHFKRITEAVMWQIDVGKVEIRGQVLTPLQ